MSSSGENIAVQHGASGARTRRALLGAGIATVVASVASALGRPQAVRAHPGSLQLQAMNEVTSTTYLVNKTNDDDVFEVNASDDGTAIVAESQSGFAVFGFSESFIAVRGGSNSSTGVLGLSGSGVGVHGSTAATTAAGVLGRSTANRTGVMGISGGPGTPVPSAMLRTGVYGQANQNSASRGVWGSSSAGIGVLAASATGFALRVNGRARFTRSGKVNFSAGQSSRTINVTQLGSNSLVLATIQGNVAGTWVRGVSLNLANNSFTIRLNKPAPSALTVGWFIVN